MKVFAAILIIPWLFAMVLTPATIAFAHRFDLLDRPTARKAHKKPVAMLGGVALFLAMVLGVAALAPFVPPLRPLLFGYGSLGALALGCGLMVALGLWDDLYDLSALQKALGQIAIAALTYWMGFQAGAVELPFGFDLSDAAPISFAVTVIWIVVVANAFNLIDGMDGLASGVSLITALTVFLLANQYGATVPVIAALALSGALAGFLRFNLPPARIFLGDAGALSIGYLTAVLALASYQKAPAAVALIVPLLVLGLPLLDTILAVVRRGLSHVSQHGTRGLGVRELLSAVTRADRGHLHHLLLRNGLSVTQSLLVLYAICVALAAIGFETRAFASDLRFGIFGVLVAAGYGALRLLERRASRIEADAARAALASAEEITPATEQRVAG
ncbi:MAG TPA: MraY family glycosyltransferase [Myxococcota bacterium]|nr:MraY family glycosyltransferase [Myxococcota bacterium]